MSKAQSLGIPTDRHRPTTAPRGLCVVGAVLYALAFVLLLSLLPEEALAPESGQFILIIGSIGMWRYSWGAVHQLRAIFYRLGRFPDYRAAADALGDKGKLSHLYVLVTSYRVEPEVNVAVYTRLIEEAAEYGVPTTIVASVGDHADEELLRDLIDRMETPRNVELVLMQQEGTGKRSAMAEALRAISRRMPPPGSAVLFMDGDVWVPPGSFAKTMPFFALMPDVGALTCDNRGITEGSNWTKEWYDVRFAQRHVLMCSLGLSKKLLVLTGRFSAFRADLVVRHDFIDAVENDYLDHWRFGRFRFLTGDDKSTWFWLLRNRWNMLYLPDVQVMGFEKLPTPSLIDSSLKLMVRWFGNMLRNNGRAVALGPRVVGPFTWWALVDQRMSMWTSLTGPVFTAFSSVVVTPYLILVYLTWVMFTRFIQAAIIGVVRRRFSPYAPFLLYYTQVVGSAVKIFVSFRVNRQKWTRQNITGKRGVTVLTAWAQDVVSGYVNLVAVGVFLFAMALGAGLLAMPDGLAVRSLQAAVLPAPAAPDGDWIQAAIDRAPPGGEVRLPAGRYRLTRPLSIGRGEVALIGAPGQATELVADFPGDGRAVLEIRGELPAEVPKARCATLAVATAPGARSLILSAPLAAAGVAHLSLRAPNDDRLLDRLGATAWRKPYPMLRQTLAAVRNIQGRRVALRRPVGFAFPVGTPICPIRLLQGVEVRDLVIRYDRGVVPDPGRYENAAAGARIDGIAVQGTAGTRIADVTVRHAGRHAINLDTVLAPRLARVAADGAYNKGAGGNGYFRLARTYHAAVDGLTLAGLRHLTIQWSSHGNRIAGLVSDADVNFHGGLTHDNRVEAAHLAPRPGHPWAPVARTPRDAAWAPPDGAGNRVFGPDGGEIAPERQETAGS